MIASALIFFSWDARWTLLALAGSSGLAQPCRMLNISRNGSKSRCQPGGAIFRDFPVCRSTRAAIMCTWTPPDASSCRTADQAVRSGSIPAQASRSKWSSTSSICSGEGLSSGAQAMTPAVRRCLNARESAIWPTRNGSPRNTATLSRGRPLWSLLSSR